MSILAGVSSFWHVQVPSLQVCSQDLIRPCHPRHAKKYFMSSMTSEYTLKHLYTFILIENLFFRSTCHLLTAAAQPLICNHAIRLPCTVETLSEGDACIAAGVPEAAADRGPARPDGAAQEPADQHPPSRHGCCRGSCGTQRCHASCGQCCPAGKL